MLVQEAGEEGMFWVTLGSPVSWQGAPLLRLH